MTRDEIAALIDEATPDRAELLRRLDRWGSGALGHHWIGKRSAAQDCLDAGIAIQKLQAIATAAIAAMDREAALLARVAELEAGLSPKDRLLAMNVQAARDYGEAIKALMTELAALRAQADMATSDEGWAVAEDGAMMPEDVAAKVREHDRR